MARHVNTHALTRLIVCDDRSSDFDRRPLHHRQTQNHLRSRRKESTPSRADQLGEARNSQGSSVAVKTSLQCNAHRSSCAEHVVGHLRPVALARYARTSVDVTGEMVCKRGWQSFLVGEMRTSGAGHSPHPGTGLLAASWPRVVEQP